MIRMNKIINDIKDEGMRAGMIIIIMVDMQVKADSLKVETTDHDDHSRASCATMNVTGMQTVHTKTD